MAVPHNTLIQHSDPQQNFGVDQVTPPHPIPGVGQGGGGARRYSNMTSFLAKIPKNCDHLLPLVPNYLQGSRPPTQKNPHLKNTIQSVHFRYFAVCPCCRSLFAMVSVLCFDVLDRRTPTHCGQFDCGIMYIVVVFCMLLWYCVCYCNIAAVNCVCFVPCVCYCGTVCALLVSRVPMYLLNAKEA